MAPCTRQSPNIGQAKGGFFSSPSSARGRRFLASFFFLAPLSTIERACFFSASRSSCGTKTKSHSGSQHQKARSLLTTSSSISSANSSSAESSSLPDFSNSRRLVAEALAACCCRKSAAFGMASFDESINSAWRSSSSKNAAAMLRKRNEKMIRLQAGCTGLLKARDPPLELPLNLLEML